MGRQKGEYVTLHCTHCSWGTELAMPETAASTAVPCAHCHQPLYWHVCVGCGLGYLGGSVPRCPICEEDPALEGVETL
jgi:hypothetical protein